MFTGIITDIGEIKSLIVKDDQRIFLIKTSYDINELKIGDSIACDGCCLTITRFEDDCFEVYVSSETISKTMLDEWQVGYKVNLEKALTGTPKFDGHIVTGHVDFPLRIKKIEQVGDSHKIDIEINNSIKKYFVYKGSVAINGVSLTVNEVSKDFMSVNIIPHTWQLTNISNLNIDSNVNCEVDIIAKYALGDKNE